MSKKQAVHAAKKQGKTQKKRYINAIKNKAKIGI
jgi:hypothetical protein